MKHFGAIALTITLLATGCAGGTPAASPAQGGGFVASKAASRAAVLAPGEVPAAVVAQVLPAAQKTADDASRRRGIDFFTLHDNPIGLRIGQGEGAAHVLTFLGTAKERKDLNVELRAFQAGASQGFHLNYSGPVTLGLAADEPKIQAPRGGGTRFELIYGLPGNGVTEAYEFFMNRFAEQLTRRYQARPFAFDDGPIVLAVHQNETLLGFVFTNQGAKLTLGDRKYADVQQVAYVSAGAEILASYTVIGFNPKTAAPGERPAYRLTVDDRFGTIAELGEK